MEKGFDAATGDFIWIAEADDSAENNFVEELIKPFDDPEVVLSYCESARIDGENNLIRENQMIYMICVVQENGINLMYGQERKKIYII